MRNGTLVFDLARRGAVGRPSVVRADVIECTRLTVRLLTVDRAAVGLN